MIDSVDNYAVMQLCTCCGGYLLWAVKYHDDDDFPSMRMSLSGATELLR